MDIIIVLKNIVYKKNPEILMIIQLLKNFGVVVVDENCCGALSSYFSYPRVKL